MSDHQGTQGQGAVVDYAELIVQSRPLLRRLESQLNAQDILGATTTALELKVLFGALYWHLAEIPRLAIHYDACLQKT